MALRAGFAQADITPALGTEKIGMLQKIITESIIDPLYAHVVVFESGSVRVGFVSLDIACVTAAQAARIRKLGEEAGVPGPNLLVAATHNHAGPATITLGPTMCDDAYVELMIGRIGEALASAVAKLVPAQIGISSCTEGRVGFTRRFIMKDGTVRTQPPAGSPDIRCAEGVIDPELGAVCVKDASDRILGFLVNFACHPTHHGGTTGISAGWPGQLSLALKHAHGEHCVTVFLNGASGNVHYINRLDPGPTGDMEWMGTTLASRVTEMVSSMEFTSEMPLSSSRTMLNLPYRDIDGPYGVDYKLAQPFASKEVYAASWEKLRREIVQPAFAEAEVQCIRLGDETAFATVPAELFSQLGLRIKMRSAVPRTFVVGLANGNLGYVPHKEAFDRGGYETTLAEWSMMAPEAGDMLAEAALDLLGRREEVTRASIPWPDPKPG